MTALALTLIAMAVFFSTLCSAYLFRDYLRMRKLEREAREGMQRDIDDLLRQIDGVRNQSSIAMAESSRAIDRIEALRRNVQSTQNSDMSINH